MQRHEIIGTLKGLGLKGMVAAFDDAVTNGIRRDRTVMEMLGDLLRAEVAHREAASIRYRMTAARLPAIKDLDGFVFDDTPINKELVRSLHAGSFLPEQRNIVLIGGTGTGKTHLATAIERVVDGERLLHQRRRPHHALGQLGVDDPLQLERPCRLCHRQT